MQIVRIAGAVAVCVIAAAVVFLSFMPPLVAEVAQREEFPTQAEFTEPGTAIVQEFVASSDHIDGAGVIIAIGRRMEGDVTFALQEGEWRGGASESPAPIATADVDLEDVMPWQNVPVRFGRVQTRPGETYRLSITTDARDVAIASSQSNLYAAGDLIVNGEVRPNDLIFRIYRGAESRDFARALTGAKGWTVGLGLLGMLVSAGVAGALLGVGAGGKRKGDLSDG